MFQIMEEKHVKWLRFLCSFYLHIIQTSVLLIYVNRSRPVLTVLS